MSSVSPPQRSAIEKFFDNFLRESSIKWMLVSGAAIFAASSLALVATHWSSWSVPIKYLIILSYTAATYGIAEYAYRKHQLQATSQVLRLLTLVLIPIGFLSLSWLTGEAGGGMGQLGVNLLLLVPAAGLMVYASTRIFDHWLRGRQTTFLVAYMLLCLAGALPVIDQTWLAVLFSCGFWFVMTLGVIKVNRHLFWLAEEHRWPRIFGFIPIVLLGAISVGLMATKTLGAIPLQWLGLGIVMLAGTVLMTARTIASVFRQRTGDLVRPLPWTILAPLFTGVVLIAAGVLFSFYGFHFAGTSTRAVVPTAIVAAALLLITARDTRHRGFVWAGLILIAIAYQSTPVLFSGIVESMKASAAEALHEQRLPLAFYGITYLPLLMAFAVASRVLHDRKRFEFSVPLQQFVTSLSFVLVAVAITHIKAAFLVTLLGGPAFILYAILFRDRHYVLPAVGMLVGASATAVPFLIATQLMDIHSSWSLVVLAGLGLILSATDAFDRMISRVPHANPVLSNWLVDGSGRNRPWMRLCGQAVTVCVAAIGLAISAVDVVSPGIQIIQPAEGAAWIVVLSSMLLWTMRSRSYACGFGFWLIALGGAVLWLVNSPFPIETMVATTAVTAGTVAIASYAVLRHQRVDTSVSRFAAYGHSVHSFTCKSRMVAMVLPLADVALAVFVTLVSLAYLPSLLWATVTLNVQNLLAGWMPVCGLVGLAAVLFRGPLATVSLVLTGPIVAGAVVGHLAPSLFTYGNLPLIYALSSTATLALIHRRTQTAQASLLRICSLWLSALVVLGFTFLSPITLISSAVSLLAMFLLVKDRMTSSQKTGYAILVSAQAILAMNLGTGFRGMVIALPLGPHFAAACAWMLAGSAIALALFSQPWKSLDEDRMRRWCSALRMFGLMLFGLCLPSNGIDRLDTVVLISSLAVIAANEWWVAVRDQRERHVWSGIVVVAMAVVWFNEHHTFAVSDWLIRSALILIAPVALYLARQWSGHSRLGILVRGLKIIGLASPFIVTAWSLLDWQRHAVESLTVFAAAMVLFVYSRATGQRRYTVASAVIMNLGIAALWADLSFTDPQFYLVPIGLTVIGLVQLLREELPAQARDPLRYVGALAILVSPCFEILGGSWWHLASLMVLSVVVILLAIGLRLRALIHTGAAFLCVDLVAMVIRSTIDHPGMLWMIGLLVGAVVIAIAAVCENHRERLLSRIRLLSAELSTWH
ncbi:MAG: DUF2157 domain-containing protein [Planctomycetaceae bacterium]